MEYTSFISDKEKMYDFNILSKDEFLESYSYLTEEEYDLTAKEMIEMGRKENKAKFLESLKNTLLLTNAAGYGNPLKELRYIKLDNGDEFVRPIFEDGTGENGYYDVDISGDSNIGILYDVVKNFCRKVW